MIYDKHPKDIKKSNGRKEYMGVGEGYKCEGIREAITRGTDKGGKGKEG